MSGCHENNNLNCQNNDGQKRVLLLPDTAIKASYSQKVKVLNYLDQRLINATMTLPNQQLDVNQVTQQIRRLLKIG